MPIRRGREQVRSMEALRWYLRDGARRAVDLLSQARSGLAAARYAHPGRVWSAAGAALLLLALTGAGAWWAGRPAVERPTPVSTVVLPAMPQAVHGFLNPARNAAACRSAAAELTRIAAAHPSYARLPGALRRKTDLLLSTVGQVCDPGTARSSADALRPWLIGQSRAHALSGR